MLNWLMEMKKRHDTRKNLVAMYNSPEMFPLLEHRVFMNDIYHRNSITRDELKVYSKLRHKYGVTIFNT